MGGSRSRRRWDKIYCVRHHRDARRRRELPSGKSFLTRYKRVSKRNLPLNVTIRRRRTIGLRNRRVRRIPAWINLANTPTQKRAKRIIKKYRNLNRKKKQSGESILGNLAKWRGDLGAKTLFKRGVRIGSKALSSEIGKRLVDEGIKHVPELYRLGTSTIKNKKLKY